MRNEMSKYIIGIDPGVNTGFCVWDMREGRIRSIASYKIHEAMDAVMIWHRSGELEGVIFEDARLRVWFGSQPRGGKSDIGRLQGAGSVKRDCQIWADFLAGSGIKCHAISPQGKGAKACAQDFARITGVTARINEHARDAGMLVFGLADWPRSWG